MSRLLWFVAGTLLLTGCFTTTTDFQNDAANFILTNDAMHEDLGVGFVSADCEEPENRDIGTTFLCTAVDDGGELWEFEAEIVDGDEYVLNLSRSP